MLWDYKTVTKGSRNETKQFKCIGKTYAIAGAIFVADGLT
jgi:hypothetical protein